MSTETAWTASISRSPTATGFTATIPEDAAVGTTVGTVTGSDPDGGPLTYTITAGNDADLFTIGNTTGTITTSGLLDYETATQHLLAVSVSDGSLTDQTAVTVNVADVNDTPEPVTFVDDDDSIFGTDIDRLGTAGLTKGANPPTNNRYCPTGYVTRGQMAAFLHRALD